MYTYMYIYNVYNISPENNLDISLKDPTLTLRQVKGIFRIGEPEENKIFKLIISCWETNTKECIKFSL